MRIWLSLAILAACAPGAQAALWTAECHGGALQYQQITGAEGYIHLNQGNGTYETVKLKQTYDDGKIVCGSVAAKAGPNQIAAICADNDKQAIRIVTGAQFAKGLKPEKAPVYCQAIVNVNQ